MEKTEAPSCYIKNNFTDIEIAAISNGVQSPNSDKYKNLETLIKQTIEEGEK